MITAVRVDGQPLDPGMVLAELVITHGRRDVLDGPSAGQAAVVIEQPAAWGMPTWGVGSILVLEHDPTLLAFTGRIVDVVLSHIEQADGSLIGSLLVNASGPVAALGFRNVGDEPWPAEPGSARAERILTLAEVPHAIDGAADAIVLPRDVDSRTALDLLGELVASTAAAVFDTPAGQVVYQPLAERARPVHPFRWMDFDPAFTWADFDPAFTWADFATWYSADSEFPFELPASAVEWEPQWATSESDVINHARVGYGAGAGEQQWREVVDLASIDAHGRRYRYVGTQLQDEAAAAAYASWIVTTRAQAHWSLGTVTVHLDALDEAASTLALALTCGSHVTFPGMPQPAPATIGEGIVEGWAYTQVSEGEQLTQTLTLTVSALLESLAVMTWADFPPAYTWADFPAYLTWADLTSVDVLTGA